MPDNSAVDFIVEEFDFNGIISYAKTEMFKLVFQESKPQIIYKQILYDKR